MIKSSILVFMAVGVMILLADKSIIGAGLDDRAQDHRAIREHIDTIFKAYIAKDRQKVRATHATNWRGFLLDSCTVIRGIDEYMRTADGYLRDPHRSIESYEMLEFDVRFYGDLAIVPYVARMDVRDGENTSSPLIRVLDIYEKRDGHWNQVASNTNLHPESEAAFRRQPQRVHQALREEILAAREALWHAWYSNDEPELRRTVPDEIIAINAGEIDWQDQTQILASARDFVHKGQKLLRLEFPRTEIQLYGDVAILYTTYILELEIEGRPQTVSGRGTEIFVRRDGGWVNSGWHLDSGS